MDSDDDYDFFPARRANALYCEWCYYDQQFGICNGQGKECKAMALYHQAQTCARLACLCRDSIQKPPVYVSLQDRIVALVSRRHVLSLSG